MTHNASFVRKVIYITTIAVLLMPLAYLSQPAVFTRTGTAQGGKLATLRKSYGMSQADLGDIDPASDSMRLALFGLDGVAANILWIMANEYKKKKNWEAVDVTTKQIVKLQPHFKSVWDFQAHNLSYNISVEFDNYEHRYLWVKKGIEFLMEGARKNRGEPIMYWHLGWYTGQKLGVSDERIQFRKLYRVDRDFHKLFRENGIDVDQALGADNKPDNWFTAHLWFAMGRDFADASGRPIRGKSPLIFHNQPAMSLINGCSSMEKEGNLGDFALLKWRVAGEEYARFGSRPIPTSWGQIIKLNDLESVDDRAKQNIAALDALAPGARKSLEEAKIKDKLTDAERALYAKGNSGEKLTAEDHIQLSNLKRSLAIPHAEVAEKAPADQRVKARLLADQIVEDETTVTRMTNYRGIVNFTYWRDRCQAEQLRESLAARDHLFKAEEALRKTDLTLAKSEYEKSFDAWAIVYKQFPILMDNAESNDLVDSCVRYNDVLGQLDLDFPADFVLNNLLDLFDEGKALRAQQKKSTKKPKEEQPADDKTDPKPADPITDSADPKATEPKPADPADPKPADSKPADIPDNKDQPKTETPTPQPSPDSNPPK